MLYTNSLGGKTSTYQRLACKPHRLNAIRTLLRDTHSISRNTACTSYRQIFQSHAHPQICHLTLPRSRTLNSATLHGCAGQTYSTQSSSTATLLQRETLLRRFQTRAARTICHSLLPVQSIVSDVVSASSAACSLVSGRRDASELSLERRFSPSTVHIALQACIILIWALYFRKSGCR